MWDLPGPGLEPVPPALAGGFLTTVPPGQPCNTILLTIVTINYIHYTVLLTIVMYSNAIHYIPIAEICYFKMAIEHFIICPCLICSQCHTLELLSYFQCLVIINQAL